MVEMLNAGIVREKYKIGIANSQNCQLSEYDTFVIRSTLTKIVRYGKGRVKKSHKQPSKLIPTCSETYPDIK